MDLTELQETAYATAVRHEWYEGATHGDVPKFLALVHAELSEALECWRNGDVLDGWIIRNNGKPMGFPTELADTVIWCASLAGWLGFDLNEVVLDKLRYNKERTRHHGKLRA